MRDGPWRARAAAAVHRELRLERREHELVRHGAHPLVERAPGAPGPAARAEAVRDPGEEGDEDPGEQPAGQQRGRRRDAGEVGRRHDVVELQVAEAGEHREPQQARERDGGQRRAGGRAPASTSAAGSSAAARPPRRGRAGPRARAPRRSRRGGPATATGPGARATASPARARMPASTCARCTLVGPGQGRPHVLLRRVGEPQALERVGPQRGAPTRPTAARWRARRGGGARGARPPRRPGCRPPSRAWRAGARGRRGAARRGLPSPAAASSAAAALADVGREPGERRLAPRHPLLQRRRAARRGPRPSAPTPRAPARRRARTRRAAGRGPRGRAGRRRPGGRSG